MPILTLFLGGISGPPQLQFLDSTGLNPLPAGIIVTLASTGIFVTSGMLQAGGFFPTTVNTGTYVATFIGTQAPLLPTTFYCSGIGQSTVIVANYQSPIYSAAGYASESSSHLVRGWFVGAS